MKKIVYRLFIVIFLIISIFISYFSIFGITTTKLNNQIGEVVKNINKDFKIELKEIKIILDPFKFQINAKTVGPKFKLKDKTIDIENIKTQISINSLFNNDFSIKNLDITTRSLEIKNLISFSRNLKNIPELYFLEKVIKKGYLISNITLEFDDQGKIKENYKIKGFIKDTKISLFKKNILNNINFSFDFDSNKFKFEDVELSLNNIPIQSEKIIVKSLNSEFFIEGTLKSKNISLKKNAINNIIKINLPNLKFQRVDFSSDNQFSFKINKKFKINNLKLSSELKVSNLSALSDLKLRNVFPKLKKEILFKEHLIKIDYDDKNLNIKGNGAILFQESKDKINYEINKKNKLLKFKVTMDIEKNPIVVDFLNYKKDEKINSSLSLSGKHVFEKKTIIDNFTYTEDKNQFIIDQLVLNKFFKMTSFDKIKLNYFDQDMRQNDFKIVNKKETYSLTGLKLNANTLVENLIKDEKKNNFEILKESFNLKVKIDHVYLDNDHKIKDLNGYLSFKKNQISEAELDAFFSNSEKFKFTVKSNQSEKVTTLFLDQAVPVIKRYKFIKGFSGGSLDFYSSKKGEKSVSNLKVYNFKLKELPILTKILTLASLQGIADILSGEGITFDEFEMNFNNQNNLMTIDEMYAIGPAISILMDGYIENNKLISLRGSLVPATTINKAIGTIPVLGKILVGSKTGEGVFGVSFKIKGPPKKLETTVNPIKTLTPRFITRTLENIKKN